MRILQICNKPPYPPYDGGSIGMHNLTQSFLDAGYKVKVLSINTPKHKVELNSLPNDYREQTGIEFGFIDTDVRAKDALFNLIFSRRSYNIVRFEDKDFAELIMKTLKENEFDIVMLESVFLNYYVPVIRKFSKAKIVLRAPNVEYKIWERMAEEEKNPVKKYYLKLLAKRLKKEELASYQKFDAICTVSANDLQQIKAHGYQKPIEFIPIGLDVTKKQRIIEKQVPEYPSLFHIGALDWRPNQEGLSWFLDFVWSKLSKQFPKMKFYIAGRGDASWLDISKYNHQLVFLGEIDDAAAFIQSKAIMVVPLFSGSGMRVKIIEGMMMGKAIVSTTIGVEGIMARHEHDILIGDTPHDFIEHLSRLVSDKDFFEKISAQAKATALENYNHEKLTSKLKAFLDTLV